MSSITQTSTASFRIVDQHCRNFPDVVKTFNERIQPIYGSQEAALDKVGKSNDRICEMLFDNGAPKALVVYKKAVSTEHIPSKKTLELKTLIVMNPEVDSGKGYGSILAQRVEQVARDRLADGVFVTVSSEKPEALAFFKKKGFTTQNSFPNLYKQGSTEEFLFLDLPLRILKKAHQPSNSSSSNTIAQPEADPKKSKTEHSSSSTTTIIPTRINQPTTLGNSRLNERPTSSFTSVRISTPIERAATASSSAYRGVSHQPSHSQGRLHTSTLGRQYIQQIQAGTKTYEGRINSGPFLAYRVGDTANWFAGDQQVETKITDKRVFRTFREMLTSVGYRNMLPTARSLDEAVAEYDRIPSYTERAQRSGVVAFGLEVLPRAHGTKRPYGTI